MFEIDVMFANTPVSNQNEETFGMTLKPDCSNIGKAGGRYLQACNGQRIR